ncbi:MAG: M1 family metallopeptidase [Thermoprotei archaeon]
MQVEKYEIFVDVDYKNSYYKGSEKVYVKTEDEVVLDAVELKITSVKDQNGRPLPFEYKDNRLTIKTGNYSGFIEVEFEAPIKDKLSGLYRAKERVVKDGKEETLVYFTTQFESIHAREFIPCADDPNKKAVFKLTVRVDKDLDVISNMPIESVKEEGDKKVVTFQETPRMSTYLLYLGIGKFEELRDDYNGKPLIVATPPGKSARGKFAVDVAKKSLAFYEEYFGIPYILPKLHLIVVPEFAAGAMENWGAITFRETALLADETSSESVKKRVAEVVAHELAHQWFGNLVTMDWWDDLWLNESFATFMSYKAVSANYRQWDMWGDFVSSETGPAFFRDSFSTTHPIHAEIKDPHEIEQIFDDITYGKGASILRMIEGFVGERAFRDGVRLYLKEHEFGNAKAHDLWSAIERASGINGVAELIEDWVTSPGHPVIHVSVEGKKIRLRQERFWISQKLEDRVYKIPLTMVVNGRQLNTIFSEREKVVDVGEEVRSLRVNVDRTGFYRVHYEGESLDLFLKAKPNAYEKYGLLDDYLRFAMAGLISVDDYLKVAKAFFSDRDYLVVQTLTGHLLLLWSLNQERYQQILRDYVFAQLDYWRTRRDELGRMTYGQLLEAAAWADRSFARGLGSLFDAYDHVLPDAKQAVAVAFALSYGESAYDALLEKYRKSKYDEDRNRLLTAMLSFPKPGLVVNTLSLALTGEIKRQEAIRIPATAAFNPYSRYEVWKWLKTHFEFLRNLSSGIATFARSMRAAMPRLALATNEVEEFFSHALKENRYPDMNIEIRTGLEMIPGYKRLAGLA